MFVIKPNDLYTQGNNIIGDTYNILFNAFFRQNEVYFCTKAKISSECYYIVYIEFIK